VHSGYPSWFQPSHHLQPGRRAVSDTKPGLPVFPRILRKAMIQKDRTGFCFDALFCLTPWNFAFYNFIAGYEEKLMLDKYGEDYQKYQNKVGKWFPQSFK